MSVSSDEHELDNRKYDLTSIQPFHLLYIIETILTIMSALVIGYYALYFPLNHDWVPILSNLEMGLVFLSMLLLGFTVSTYAIIRISNRMSIEDTINISKIRALILTVPSLFILNVTLGIVLTLALNGTLTSIVLGIFTLYGYGIGYLIARMISRFLGLHRWQITQNSISREITISAQK